MQTSAPHRWQLAREPRFVLFWWWTGSTALSDLKVYVFNKMLWPFTASALTTRASPYWWSQSSRNFNSEQRSTASYILLPVSQWKPRAEQKPFEPNWSASSVLAFVWPTPVLASVKSYWRGSLVNLHPPTPFAQIGQGYLRRDLCEGICYTSGNHGSIWANFCSPSKTTKLV